MHVCVDITSSLPKSGCLPNSGEAPVREEEWEQRGLVSAVL